MAKTTEIYKTPELDELEHELLQAREMLELAKDEVNILRDRYLSVMEEAGKNRTEHFRVVTQRSGRTLDADAIARHFGCDVAFLQQFRKSGTKSLTIRAITAKKGKDEDE